MPVTPKTIAVLTRTEHGLRAAHTTACLLDGLLARGHRVLVSQASGLSMVGSGRFLLRGRLLDQPLPGPGAVVATLSSSRGGAQSLAVVDAAALDAVVIRDASPGTALQGLLPLLEAAGVPVLNPPAVLRPGSSRTLAMEVPEPHRPETVITASEVVLRAFLQDLDAPAVLKPFQGHGGDAVFHLRRGQRLNLGAIFETVREAGGGLVVAQRYVEDPRGETRVVIVDGQPAGAYLRRSSDTDLCRNLGRGGQPLAHELTQRELESLEALRPVLQRSGVWLAGVDLIGSRITEVNVHSPGGVHWIRAFGGDPLPAILDALEERLALHESRSVHPTQNFDGPSSREAL